MFLAFAPFMDPKACREHLAGYTFPITWKLGPVLSRVLAAVFGPLFAWLVCSTGAIPVYRNSLKVRETYQQSMKALEEGGMRNAVMKSVIVSTNRSREL